MSERESSLEKKAHLLSLSSVALAEGMKTGSFRSLYRGHGIDFSGVREYHFGDDVRSIDWNVTARMGRTFVKLYDEEKELDVLLVVDTSLSMSKGASRRSRLSVALECASLITLASFRNRCPVGAVMFDSSIQFASAPVQGKEQMMLLLSAFQKEGNTKKEKGSALDNALKVADRLLKKHTLIMVFSDFRTSGWTKPFLRLSQKHDMIAVRIKDSLDEVLPAIGSVRFCDTESSRTVTLPTSSAKFKRLWNDTHFQHFENWKHECMRNGGIPLIINTASEPVVSLTNFFSSREVR